MLIIFSEWNTVLHFFYNLHFIKACSCPFSECPKHCSMCYNETQCYECTQGYFLNGEMECESRYCK